jgi:N-acetylneuraminic acid mutarotase
MKQLYKILPVFIVACFLYACLNDPLLSDEIINGGAPEITGDSIGLIKANSIEAFAVIARQNGSTVKKYGFYVNKEGDAKVDTIKTEGVQNDGKIEFSVTINELQPHTWYIIKAFAENEIGESLGVSFKKQTNNGLGSVSTLKPDSVKGTSATVGGLITETGEGSILECGIFLYSRPEMLPLDTVIASLQVDSFALKLSGLDTMTTYYVQAFARNNFGTFTGEIDTFKTKNGKPEFLSFNLLGWGFVDASYVAELLTEGDSPLIAKGVCWSATSSSPTINDQVSANATGDFSGVIEGLTPFTKYYIRAFATNHPFGTTYSEALDFTTYDNQPVVETTRVISISNGFVGMRGMVVSAGMGTITAAGFCWSTEHNPSVINYRKDIENIDDSFTSEFTTYISGLRGGTTYYIRAFAQNSGGQIAYGNELEIVIPEIFTSMAPFIGGTRIPNSVASFTIGNIAYLVGGDKGTEYTDEFLAYNASDRWDRLPSFPDVARKWQTGVVVNNIAYVFGGLDASNDRTNKMYRYLPNQNRWDLITPASSLEPAPLHSAASGGMGNMAYFIGGNRDSILDEIWKFDAYSHTWEAMNHFPVKQYGGIAIAIGNVMYAGLGLSNALGTASNKRLWSSDNNLNTWVEETPLPAAAGIVRGGVAYNDAIYIVDSTGNIWKYDVGEKIWTKKSKLPSSHAGDSQHCIFVLNNMIYIGLGVSQQSLLKYDPAWDN